MSDGLDVSVVISTFNRPTQLERALRALVAQDVPASLRYEIIVVDNNSSDNTREVVAAFEREHGPRVRYVFECRQGCPSDAIPASARRSPPLWRSPMMTTSSRPRGWQR